MKEERKPVTILIADDDDDDALLIEKALKESKLLNKIYRVKDGEELMDFLNRKGEYANEETSPTPTLILLDLNMPKKDGREALKEIKGDSILKHIPITILTTSKADEDIIKSYDLGVNSFITKPVELNKFIEVVKEIGIYWFEVVQLPVQD